MGGVKSFEDLEVWKRARVLCTEIYRITSKGDFSKDFGLRDQIRRAAVSISSNIAERFERQTTKEFIRFLYMAKGSAGEARTQLYSAIDLEYLTLEDFEMLKNRTERISRMLSKFIKYLSSLQPQPTLKP